MGAVRHNRHTRTRVIEEFRRTGRVDLACAAAGCDRDNHYIWLKKYPEYAGDFERAREQVAGLLEDEAVRRAYQGTIKPMSVGGKLVMVHEFSDQLLIFLLKCRNKKVFGDRLELAGDKENPLEVNLSAKESLEARIAGIASRIGAAGGTGEAERTGS